MCSCNLCLKCLICSLERGFKVHLDPVKHPQQHLCLLWWGLLPKPHLMVTLKQCRCVFLYHSPSLSLFLSVSLRRCFQTAHFYVEDSNSPRVVPNESIPVIPIPGILQQIHFRTIKHSIQLYTDPRYDMI